MSRGEDHHTVVIDQEDGNYSKGPWLKGNIASEKKDDDTRQDGNYSNPDKRPRLKGNTARDEIDDEPKQLGNYDNPDKGPRLKGNIASDGIDDNPRLKGNIAGDKKDDDLVEIDNLMMKWEEILKAGYNFDKGKHFKYLNCILK